MIRKHLFVSLITILVVSCTSSRFDVDVDLSNPLVINEFDEDIFQVNPSNIDSLLPVLREKYPKFIPEDYQNERYQKSLLSEVSYPLHRKLKKDKSTFAPNKKVVEEKLNGVLAHYNHYYPNQTIEYAYTFISGLDKRMDPVMYDSNSVVIAIDQYYGENYPVYEEAGIYKYQRELMRPEYLEVDIARYLALSRFEPLAGEATFLEHMIYQGRINYFVNAMIPELSELRNMRYSEKDLSYCEKNEQRIWTYWIEEEKLYIKDQMEIGKYVESRPFINSHDPDSPDRVGVWFGRKIVDSYMERENVTLQELMQKTDLNEIFIKSKYKP